MKGSVLPEAIQKAVGTEYPHILPLQDLFPYPDT